MGRVVSLLWLAASTLVASVAGDRVRAVDNILVDSQGRQVLHHGINVVVKHPPYHPVVTHYDPEGNSLVAQDIANFKEWGFNVVRLGVMWPGVEPAPGQFNYTYLNLMRKIVDQLGEAGIYTLVDFHQDNLGPRWCGEGTPEWFGDLAAKAAGVDDMPWPLQGTPFKTGANGIPVGSDCSKFPWGEFYVTHAQGAAWHALYKNHSGLADYVGAYWRVVAETFRTSEWVVGYELINEPWGGDVTGDLPWSLDLLFFGIADHRNLQPFYEALAHSVRLGDPEAVIFFESVTYDDFFPVGFTSIPGGPEFADRTVLSYHYYSAINFEGRALHWDVRMSDIKRLGIAGMLTEFAVYQGVDVAVKTADICDLHSQGWIGWLYREMFDNGVLNVPLAAALSRTYAPRVAGRIVKSGYSEDTHIFALTYVAGSGAHGATEIHINEALNYPNGFIFNMSISGDSDATPTWKAECGRILVEATSGLADGTRVTITITPIGPIRHSPQAHPTDPSASLAGEDSVRKDEPRFSQGLLLKRIAALTGLDLDAARTAVVDRASAFLDTAYKGTARVARDFWDAFTTA